MDYINEEYIQLLLIPLLVALLEVIKRTEIINAKFIPVISLVLGIALGVLFTGFDLKEGIMIGMIMGLSAVGLYSGSANVAEGLSKKE